MIALKVQQSYINIVVIKHLERRESFLFVASRSLLKVDNYYETVDISLRNIESIVSFKMSVNLSQVKQTIKASRNELCFFRKRVFWDFLRSFFAPSKNDNEAQTNEECFFRNHSQLKFSSPPQSIIAVA